MTPHSRDTLRPSFAITFAPKRKRAHATLKRGRREDRVRAAPAVSCAKLCKRNAHEHTGSAEAVRPSLRNGFTAYFVLSLVTGLSCHHRPREALAAHELDASVGASGPHDFAVRISAARLATLTRPPQPVPTSVTWPTPLLAGQDGCITPVICLEKTPEYFLAVDWTAQISLIRLDNFVFTHTPI